MRISIGLLTVVASAFLLPTGCGQSAPVEEKSPAATGTQTAPTAPKTEGMINGTQQTCPIMTGNKIDRALYVDAKGHRIYVCCPACQKMVKADPDKAVAALRARGEEPEKLPTPVQ